MISGPADFAYFNRDWCRPLNAETNHVIISQIPPIANVGNSTLAPNISDREKIRCAHDCARCRILLFPLWLRPFWGFPFVIKQYTCIVFRGSDFTRPRYNGGNEYGLEDDVYWEAC
jgi:hypothetical protein